MAEWNKFLNDFVEEDDDEMSEEPSSTADPSTLYQWTSELISKEKFDQLKLSPLDLLAEVERNAKESLVAQQIYEIDYGRFCGC